MQERADHDANHQFIIRLWQETCCRKPTEWRARIHHVNSGNVFFSTDLDHAFDQIRIAIGLTDDE